MTHEDAPRGLLAELAVHNVGHFTTMLLDARGVRGLGLHLARLERDSRALFGVAVSLEGVRDLLAGATSHRGTVVARLTSTVPGFEPARPGAVTAPPRITVTVREAPTPTTLSRPLRLGCVSHSRYLPAVKHTALLPSWMARRTAQSSGYDDAVLTDARGALSESPAANLAFLTGTRLVLSDAEALAGTALTLVTAVAADLGLAIEVATVTGADLQEFDTAFTTSAVAGVRRVESIDGHVFPGPTALVGRLADAFWRLPVVPLDLLP